MKCSLVISDFLEEIFSLSVCVFSFYGRGDGGDGSFLQQGLCQDCCVQCSRPHLCQSLLATHRHVWLCLLWGSLLLSPGSWNTEGFVCVLQSLFPQCCVTFDGSMVGLMVTSSKRAYAIPTQQYCIGTWNVRPMSQGILEVVKQEMATVMLTF